MTQYTPYNPEVLKSPEQLGAARVAELGRARDLINQSIIEMPKAKEVSEFGALAPRAVSAIVGLADVAPAQQPAAEAVLDPQDVIDIDAAMSAVQAAFDSQALEQV